VTDYGLDDRGSIPDRDRRFFSSLSFQTGSGAHPASYPMGTGRFFPGVKRGRGVMLTTHPHLAPRLSMSRNYTSSPPCASMACSGTAFYLSINKRPHKISFITVQFLFLKYLPFHYSLYAAPLFPNAHLLCDFPVIWAESDHFLSTFDNIKQRMWTHTNTFLLFSYVLSSFLSPIPFFSLSLFLFLFSFLSYFSFFFLFILRLFSFLLSFLFVSLLPPLCWFLAILISFSLSLFLSRYPYFFLAILISFSLSLFLSRCPYFFLAILISFSLSLFLSRYPYFFLAILISFSLSLFLSRYPYFFLAILISFSLSLFLSRCPYFFLAVLISFSLSLFLSRYPYFFLAVLISFSLSLFLSRCPYFFLAVPMIRC
jgi:hypothetical protein